MEVSEGSNRLSGSPATATDDGTWKIDLTGVSEDEHTYTATATDAAGNTSGEATVKVTVDKTKPTTPSIDSPRDGATTNSSVISGRGEAGSKITLSDKGTELTETITVGGDGNWSLTPTLSEGSHLLKAEATDATANESESSNEVSFTLDTVVPEAPAITEPKGGNYKTGEITFKGTAEAGSLVTLYDGTTKLGEATADGSGTWTFSPNDPLGEGSHPITAKAVDKAGNTSGVSSSVTLVVDTASPSVPVITTPNAKGYDNDGDFTVSGTAEPKAKVTLSEGGTPQGDEVTANESGKWSIELTGVVKGKHTYTAVATDAAGNPSAASAPAVMIVDKAAPTVTRAEPADGATGHSIDRNVVARFSERMNPNTLTARNVRLINTRTGAEVKAEVRCDNLCRTLRLDPDRNLERNTKYRVVITTRVKDLAGNRLAQNMVWHSTTEA